MKRQRHTQQPPIISGYILNPNRGHWSIEVPSEQTNWIENPSTEVDTTNWSGSGGATAVSRSSAWAYSGLYSLYALGVFGNTAAVYFQSSIAAGTYMYSCALYSVNGVRLWIDITGSGFDAGRLDVTVPPGEVVIAEFPVPIVVPSTSTLGISFQVVNNGTEFYVDAQLLESGTKISPFFDGNSPGCYWLGLPDLSTSYRTLEANSGPITNFDELGFFIDQYAGAGMPSLDVQATDYAIIDGSEYDGTRTADRVLALSGRFSGTSQQVVQQQKAALIDIINRDRSPYDVPLVLRYQAYKCDVPIGKPLRATAVYVSGLEGSTDNLYAEPAVIQFRCNDPYFYEMITSGTTMAVFDQFVAPRTIRYDRNHVWSTMNGGPDNQLVRAIKRGVDGWLYVGGQFTSVNGIPQTRYLARWREDLGWQSIANLAAGVGAEPGVHTIVLAANGDMYIGGDFANVNAIASTNNIAKYRPSTAAWSALIASGANSTVRAMAIDGTGLLYLGGDFTSIGGVAANRIAKFDATGPTITALGTGMNAGVWCLAVDSANNLYVGGRFTTANGVVVSCIAYYTASTGVFSAMSGGVATVTAGTLTVFAITITPNGLVYVGGNFVTAGGVTVNHIAIWTGSSWQALGPAGSPGFTSISGNVVRAITAYNNLVHIGGFFTAAGGGSSYNGYAIWNGYSWLRGDVAPASSPTFYAIHVDKLGVTLGYDTSGTATLSKTIALASASTSIARPVFTLKNTTADPQRIYQILNATSGDSIYFDLIMLSGETIIIDTRRRRVTSTIRGDLTYTVLAGSNFATWKLLPQRTNYINVYAGGSGNTMAITINNAHWSIDGGVLR